MLDWTRKPNSAALAFLVAGSVWFIIGTIYGGFSAMHLVSPEVIKNFPPLVFGRLRPTHVDTVLYGFVSSILIGCVLFYTPSMLKTKLWSEPLAWLSFVLWNVIVLSGPFGFAVGYTQGKEYTEYEWIFDVFFMIVLLTSLLNLFMTALRRKEKELHVPIWYAFGTFIWFSGTYFIGNVMWHPKTGALSGALDPIIHWFYGHNLPGLWLTPLATGVAYYVIPRIVRKPIYSYTLSLIGFWTLVTFYTHIGAHHIVQGPIPMWLKTLSTMSSIAMVIPVFTVIWNLWATMRGRARFVLADPAGRLVFIGIVWYLIVCIQGPVQSIPYIQRVTHFNNWTVGHSHIAILGFSGFIALGGLWHIVPLITGNKIYSRRLVHLQFGFLTFGLTGFLVVLTIAGLIQGQAWNNGEVVYRVLPQIKPYMVLRMAFGIFIIVAAILGFYNLVMTLKGKTTQGRNREMLQ